MSNLKWKYSESINDELPFILPLSLLKKIYSDSFVLLECVEQNTTIAYFYFFKRKIYFNLTKIQSPLFLPYNELIVTKKNTPINIAKKYSFIKDIINSLCDFLDQEFSKSIITITLPPQIQDAQPFFWHNYKVIPFYTYQIDLSQDIDEIISCFSPEKRNSIKKAEKDGLKIIDDNNIDDLYHFIENTFERKNKYLNNNVLKKFLQHTHQNNFIKVFSCVNKDNIKIASAGFLLSNQKVYYLFSGYDPKHKHSGSIALLLFTAIRTFKESQYKIFDFEGSMLPDVEKNFREFGGNLIPYFSINKAPILLEIALKFYQRNKF
ncbi:MAG: hypothetical protein OHK0036_08160 [Bacteroidia bacterium]